MLGEVRGLGVHIIPGVEGTCGHGTGRGSFEWDRDGDWDGMG